MTAWESFFQECVRTIFHDSKTIIDFGGGLRLSRNKSDREDFRNAWIKPLTQNVDYKIFDTSTTYNPDIIGDIHKLQFENNSIDAFICLAVLEHVENPILAMSEMYRCLKPGGKILIYVPFLFYYHNHPGEHEYGDYWRFTSDTLKMFARPFSSYSLQSVKQPIETLVALTPLVRFSVMTKLARCFDGVFYRKNSEQVSGYYLYLVK